MTESKQLRVGIIGLGSMGMGHCTTMTDDVPEMTLAAVTDVDPVQLEKVAGEHGIPPFGSYQELVDSGLCDAVIVAVPHPFHPEIAIYAMSKELHVLTEKPLSERVSTADQMLAAARENNVVLAVMFQQRFAGPFAKAIEIAKSGRLGKILRTMAIIPDYRSQAYYDAGGWRATWKGEGGGVVINQSPHAVDVFVQMAGVPEKVLGRTSTTLHDIEVEDCADAMLTYADGGIGYLYCSTIEPSGNGVFEIFGDKARLSIAGGTVTLKEYDPPVSEFTKSAPDMWAKYGAKDVPVEHSSDWPNHKAVMSNFARHILYGDELLCSAESALGQLELANAIILSGCTGEEVSIPVDRAAYDAMLEKLRETGRDPVSAGGDPNSPLAKASRLSKAEGAYVSLLRKYSHTSGMGGGYWSDYCGWMFATPVTDGNHVWLKTGSDVAACYDMDGNEKWKVQTWGSGGADHTLCSPRLVDVPASSGAKARKLFVMQLNNNERSPKKRGKGGVKLLALDALTGEEVWETRGLSDNSWNDSTPGVMTLTDGQDSVKVIVTTCGTLVRVDDGKVLVCNPGVQGGFASPLVLDDTVIFGHAALAPVQFVMQSKDSIGFKRLWAIRGGSHGVLSAGGAVLVDGYIIHTVGMRRGGARGGENISALGARAEDGPGEGWRAAEAYDLAKGRYAWAVPILRKGGSQWSPASASEKHVYHIVGDHIFQSIGPKAPMDMVVTTRGAKPLRLANNAIDRTYGAGAIEDNRIYVRGYYGVTCIGYTGSEGRRYEARTIARNLLDDLYPERPRNAKVREVTMSTESRIKHYPYGDKRTVSGPRNSYLLSGQPPHRWWIAGPVPRASAAGAMTAFGSPAKALQGDETFTIGSKEYGWGPLCQSFLSVPGFKSWELDPQNFIDIHRVRRVVDLGKAIRGQSESVCYLMTELSSDSEQIMRFDQTLPGARTWLAGTEIKHGDRVKFGNGVCQLLVEITVGQFPADGLHFSPCFRASDNVTKEATDWEAAARRRLPYFETVLKLAPDSAEAKNAKRLLATL